MEISGLHPCMYMYILFILDYEFPKTFQLFLLSYLYMIELLL